MSLSQFDLAWLVGILEGEGSFRFTNRTQRVTVNMTDEDIIYKIADIFQKITGNVCNPTMKKWRNITLMLRFNIPLYCTAQMLEQLWL